MFMTVSEGHWAIREYFGKFSEVLEPGMYTYVPGFFTTKSLSSWGYTANKSGFLIEKSEQQTNTPSRHCQTKDNVTVNANTSIGWRIIDPKKAVYAIDNLPAAISDLALNTLRANIGILKLDQLFASRVTLNEKIRTELADTVEKWGIELLRVEIQKLSYSDEVERSMMKLMTADRERQSLITRAEGQAQSSLMLAESEAKMKIIEANAYAETQVIDARTEADVMLISTKAEADALVVTADAEAKAYQLKAKAEENYLHALKQEIGQDQAAEILKAEKNRESLEKITENPSHKIFIPLDAQIKIKV